MVVRIRHLQAHLGHLQKKDNMKASNVNQALTAQGSNVMLIIVNELSMTGNPKLFYHYKLTSSKEKIWV